MILEKCIHWGKFKQQLSLDDQMFQKCVEGDQSTFLTAPKSLGWPLFCRLEDRAAA